jgi:hypothetical protein
MSRRLLSFASIPILLTAIGCAAFVAGAGAGAGVYVYMKGELKRSYQASYDATVAACTGVFDELRIDITDKSWDGIRTIVQGMHSGKTPVKVKIVMQAPSITEVTVRAGITGVWDKKVSELIHVKIAQKLR